jgi:ribosome recycling factor
MLDDIKKDADARMGKSITALKAELARIRTGRAHPSLLEHVTVDYYGSEVPLNQAANVNIEDPRTLSVVPFDKSMVGKIEKAIMTSDLGLNPATAGANIRVPLPALTEERRQELAKVVHAEGEQAKIAIRNIRRDANNQLKDFLKEKGADRGRCPARRNADPTAHRQVRRPGRRTGGGQGTGADGNLIGDFSRFTARTHRHHHGWQRPLGAPPGAPAHRWA